MKKNCVSKHTNENTPKKGKKLRKTIVLCIFAVLLLVTGGANLYINSMVAGELGAEQQVSTSTASFFDNYRTDRQSTRDQELLYLEAIISSTTASNEAKATAEAEMQSIIANMSMTANLESLIKAKGFSDVVVSAVSSNISVIVETSGLDKAQVGQIVDIIQTNTSYALDNIKIIEV